MINRMNFLKYLITAVICLVIASCGGSGKDRMREPSRKSKRNVEAVQKSSTKIGTAVWIADNCIANKDGVRCNNCERHCPNVAIKMIKKGEGKDAPRIPMIDAERCLGCGACEYVCPARPFSAIFVEGIEEYRIV